MDELTGVEYPKIELGGKTYEVKFTRAMFYKMSKAGINFTPKFINGKQAMMPFHELVDVMKLAISFDGSADDLAELLFDKRGEALTILVNAWSPLVLPSLQLQLQEAEANRLMEQPAGKPV